MARRRIWEFRFHLLPVTRPLTTAISGGSRGKAAVGGELGGECMVSAGWRVERDLWRRLFPGFTQ